LLRTRLPQADTATQTAHSASSNKRRDFVVGRIL
jgi:hypothetical protein